MGKISYDDKLCKGLMSTKLTRPQPTRLPCMDASSISLQSKPKTHVPTPQKWSRFMVSVCGTCVMGIRLRG